MSRADTAVIVSFYDQTEVNFLCRLLKQLDTDLSRKFFDLFLIINSEEQKPTILPYMNKKISILYRENTGMNIGAWDYGWRKFNNYQNYIFLQDECGINRSDWFQRYRSLLEDQSVGVVGESIAFDLSWDEAIEKLSTLQHHYNNLVSWGIDPGERATHIQSLVWATRRDVLNMTDGFKIGTNKVSCISAEVAFSKQIVNSGLKLRTAGDNKFTYFSHHQWDEYYTIPYRSTLK